MDGPFLGPQQQHYTRTYYALLLEVTLRNDEAILLSPAITAKKGGVLFLDSPIELVAELYVVYRVVSMPFAGGG